MTIEQSLDRLIGPRPNGSPEIEEVATYLEGALESLTPHVETQLFDSTPYGFALLCVVTLILALFAMWALFRHRNITCLGLIFTIPLLMILEMEFLQSPISGLITSPAKNIVATFPGSDGPLIILAAHYDTATQIGDHFHWLYAAIATALGIVIAVSLSVVSLVRRKATSRASLLIAMPFVILPFAITVVQQSIGPMVREPSPGALDNAGSIAILLDVAEQLSERKGKNKATIQIVFLAGEEERTLGSLHFVQSIKSKKVDLVINLESVGGPGPIAFAEEEAFLIRRYPPSAIAVESVRNAANMLELGPLNPMPLPGTMYTDGRSFLAADLPAITLISYSEGGPRHLHSKRDNRQRLSVESLQQVVKLLMAVVNGA